MASLTVEIGPPYAQWAWSDVDPPLVLEQGVHEIKNPSAALLRALASAEAAGVLTVKGASKTHAKTLKAAVEPDRDSRRFQAKVDKIRERLLPERDAALYAAHPSEHTLILEAHEAEVDLAARRELAGEDV